MMWNRGYERAAQEYERNLEKQWEEYFNGCEPKVVGVHQEPEGFGEYSTSPIYNCHDCDDRECEYWSDYNHD